MIDPELIKKMMMGDYSAQTAYPSQEENSHKTFGKTLDLHIEKLHPSHTKLTPKECLDFQLLSLGNFLENMRKQNVRRCDIIYGKGKGTLKTAVDLALKDEKGIKKYILLETCCKITFL